MTKLGRWVVMILSSVMFVACAAPEDDASEADDETEAPGDDADDGAAEQTGTTEQGISISYAVGHWGRNSTSPSRSKQCTVSYGRWHATGTASLNGGPNQAYAWVDEGVGGHIEVQVRGKSSFFGRYKYGAWAPYVPGGMEPVSTVACSGGSCRYASCRVRVQK